VTNNSQQVTGGRGRPLSCHRIAKHRRTELPRVINRTRPSNVYNAVSQAWRDRR